MKVSDYSTLIFDCDGVVLNSNKVKTEAFYQAALPYGEYFATQLVRHHVSNGGVSRYKKFSYFLEKIVGESSDQALNYLLDSYSHYVRNGLLECSIAPSLIELRDASPNNRWLIVSGGDQAELHEIFERREISNLFDGGIFGSPDTKEIILAREISENNIIAPGLFLGDSKYDYNAAKSAGLDFLFLTDWTEVKDWQSWVVNNKITYANNLCELI
jgi:phosphoglycolate phosphatase-like HAD superfamily hydrolase